MRIKTIEGSFAVVEAGSLHKRINIEMLPRVKTGDYVMVHAGFAIEKVDRLAAEETLKAIDEIRR